MYPTPWQSMGHGPTSRSLGLPGSGSSGKEYQFYDLDGEYEIGDIKI